MKSMTGVGTARAVLPEADITVEMKTVNHRYRDFYIRLPHGYSILEEKLRSQISQVIQRGHIEVDVKVRFSDSSSSVSISQEISEAYMKPILSLTESGHFREIDPVSFLLLPGVIDQEKEAIPSAELYALIHPVLTEALRELDEGRMREGAKLQSEFVSRIENIRLITRKLALVAESLPAEYLAVLKERLAALEEKAVNEERLIAEMLIYADKISIAEELTRLSLHTENFLKELAAEDPVGRKLDFLLQEINREANTVASKCNSFDASVLAVEIKSELEKIREQVQNVE